jgi:hypothetical protein
MRVPATCPTLISCEGALYRAMHACTPRRTPGFHRPDGEPPEVQAQIYTGRHGASSRGIAAWTPPLPLQRVSRLAQYCQRTSPLRGPLDFCTSALEVLRALRPERTDQSRRGLGKGGETIEMRHVDQVASSALLAAAGHQPTRSCYGTLSLETAESHHRWFPVRQRWVSTMKSEGGCCNCFRPARGRTKPSSRPTMHLAIAAEPPCMMSTTQTPCSLSKLPSKGSSRCCLGPTFAEAGPALVVAWRAR